MEVGFRMFILVVTCVAMRGLRPSPVRGKESVSGALLGLLVEFGTVGGGLYSFFNLWVIREQQRYDMHRWAGLGPIRMARFGNIGPPKSKRTV